MPAGTDTRDSQGSGPSGAQAIFQSVLIYLSVQQFRNVAYPIAGLFVGIGLILVLAHIFFDLFHDSSPCGDKFLPCVADAELLPNIPTPGKPVGEPQLQAFPLYTYFTDGSLCLKMADIWVNDPAQAGQIVLALNYKDSGTTIPLKTEENPYSPTKPPYLLASHRVCVEIFAGSNQGILALWRGTIGRLLNVPISVLLGAVFPVLLLISLFLSFYVLIFSSARGVRNTWKLLFRIPKARSWTPSTNVYVPLLTQISDTHLSNDDRPYEIQQVPSQWQSPGPVDNGSRFHTILNRLQILELPKLVIISGDITDLGDPKEWEEAKKLLREFIQEKDPQPELLLMAGNHDITINVSESPDYLLHKRRRREESCFQCFQEFDGGFWRPLAKTCKTFDDLWPRYGRLDPGTLPAPAIRLFALDSNRYRSRFMTSNAIGAFGKQQLKRLERLLFQETGPVVVATHHHVTRPEDLKLVGRKELPVLYSNALDAGVLISMLADYSMAPGNTVLVIHGHKHQEIFQKFEAFGSKLFIYGHPSSTMGDYDLATGIIDEQLRFSTIGLTQTLEWTITTQQF
jgi:Calcineurin-like phosphoesterase